MAAPRRPVASSSPPSTWSGTGRASSGPSATGPRPRPGSGYALVNRTILSRVLPTLHRESGVERLAGFFRSIRAGVAAAAPEGVDEPRVVILTPGPLSETYFEHAYLASYLGYALVEGRDLVVDNNRVWLRSLGGLDPVDVVIRRVDDQWCDPVELRADSLLGVPGLLEVARRGRVTVVNPLGSGVIEDPALTGLLDDAGPGPARRGPRPPGPRDLVVRTTSRAQPRAGPPRPADRPAGAARRPSDRPVVASTLSAAALDELRDRIRARPGQWVGQEIIEPSTAPTVDRHRRARAPADGPAHLRRDRPTATTPDGATGTASCPAG